MNPTYKKINYKTYSVKKFDPELNKMVTCIYLTKETKDKLNKRYFEGLDWRVKEIIKDIKEKQQKDAQYQRQRQARYDKYILKRRSQEE